MSRLTQDHSQIAPPEIMGADQLQATREPSQASVAILLGTFNGERFLAEQLESIMSQTHHDWKIFASDDGSSDNTRDILEAHQIAWGKNKLDIRSGPAKGWVANFLTLACDLSIQADYFAFCDQDDIWDLDKLAKAIEWLQSVPDNEPALYCARTRLIDENNQDAGYSPLFAKLPTFQNALVQSIAGGNTMLFNQTTRALLCAAGPDLDIQTHDWWVYILATGCGGEVFYDPLPTVRYRQHEKNLVGSNLSFGSRVRRAHRLLIGRFGAMNNRNITALMRIHHHLTPEGRHVLNQFIKARNDWLIPRAIGINRSGVYHQTLLGNIGLIAATLLKKL